MLNKRTIILFLLYKAVVIFTYFFFKPIAFLFISGILLAILYFIQTFNISQPGSIVGKHQQFGLSTLSVMTLTILFVISLIVLRNYERPSGKHPYFTNADYHAIQNEAVAFDKSILLYAPSSDVNGLWSSESGTLLLKGNTSNPTLLATNFYAPIFYQSVDQSSQRSFFVNPAWAVPVAEGYAITDGQTSLTWNAIEVDDKCRYIMDIEFQSKDPVLLSNSVSEIPFKQNFHIEATIKKGLSIIDLLQGLDKTNAKQKDNDASSSNNSSALVVNGIVYQWLNQHDRIELIAGKEGLPGLYLQPSYSYLEDGYYCTIKGNKVPLIKKYESPLSWDQHFFVGLGRSRYELSVSKNDHTAQLKQVSKTYLLNFDEEHLLPFYNVPGRNDLEPGKTVLRFLKNSYDLSEMSEIREGFMFQPMMKINSETSVEGILEFQADRPGVPLKWNSTFGKSNEGPDIFTLNSASGNLQWIYKIKDLSDNWFGFNIVKYYLFLIVLAMIVLVVYFPSSYTNLVETPLLILAYCFLVFRYLLMWRIATFPPLENIKTYELENTLRQFDNWPLKDVPCSFTLIVVLLTLVFLMFFRFHQGKSTRLNRFIKNQNDTINRLTNKFDRNRIPFIKSIQYTIFLLFCFALSKLPIEALQRLSRIAIPLFGYLYFSYKTIENGQSIPYIQQGYRHWTNKIIPFLSTAFENEFLLISLMTLIFYGIFDTGFAIIFLMFLLIRFTLFNLLRYKKIQNIKGQTINVRLILFLTATTIISFLFLWKGGIHFLLKSNLFIIAIIFSFFALFFYLLKISTKAKKLSISFCILISFLCLFPPTSKTIENVVDHKIRLVKYRTELIYKPLEEVLFQNAFKSNQETKILETAQNQWFIHSYLKEAKFINPFETKNLIDFRPHFRTGVDYSTQTRDVVLPRYVIAEFGGFTMLLLLFCFTLPLIFYLLAYSITNFQKTVFLKDGAVGLMALLFLFTTALMLWLTSTNRFVFFGQDFPFLSITSRISALLPIGLITTVLLTKPKRLLKHEVSFGRNTTLVGIFILFILLIAFISGKSTQISDRYFRVDYSKVESHLNEEVNELLVQLQSKLDLKLIKNEDLTPEQWVPDLRTLIIALSSNDKFQDLKRDSFSLYEKTIWEELEKDVTLGVKLNSPIHFKVANGLMECSFNKYWSMELPPYDERKVWKGEVEEQSDDLIDTQTLFLINTPNLKLIRIPYSFLDRKRDLALLDITNNAGEAYIYNLINKKISNAGASAYTRLIDSSEIVIKPTEKNISTYTSRGSDKKYFARNILLNGHQQFVYPLGTKLFWARHWATAAKEKFEKTGNDALNENVGITLDYELSHNVGNFLEKELPIQLFKNSPNINDPSFSVIAADGDGKIRLMSDYAKQRKIIDPNNAQEILDEQLRSFFYIDAAKERIQWGNLNLLHMNQGPGSSFKPLLASAIISQVNAGWGDLVLEKKEPDQDFFDFNKGIQFYAGEKLRGPWKNLGENNNQTAFQQYIIKSNNLYHSLLVFLGSYSKSALLSSGGTIVNLLQPYYKTSLIDSSFPVMSIGSNQYQFYNKKRWPTSQDGASFFADSKSMLSEGIKQRFLLDTDFDNGRNIRKRKYVYSQLNDSSTWASPEYSYMLLSNRIDYHDLQGNFNKAIRQTSLGGGGVFDVTPLAMAEMYGRLATMNAGFKLTIDAQRSTQNDWYIDPDWNDGYTDFHYRTLIDAMNKVLKDGGTASQLNLNSKYFIYGKTGTIGSEDGVGKNKNSKRLALIISKEPLTSKVNSNKFYVVYFRFDNARIDKTNEQWIFDIYRNVLNRILGSSSFINYMQ